MTRWSCGCCRRNSFRTATFTLTTRGTSSSHQRGGLKDLVWGSWEWWIKLIRQIKSSQPPWTETEAKIPTKEFKSLKTKFGPLQPLLNVGKTARDSFIAWKELTWSPSCTRRSRLLTRLWLRRFRRRIRRPESSITHGPPSCPEFEVLISTSSLQYQHSTSADLSYFLELPWYVKEKLQSNR